MRGLIGLVALSCVLACSVADAGIFRRKVVVKQPVFVQRSVAVEPIFAVPRQQVILPQRQTIIFGF